MDYFYQNNEYLNIRVDSYLLDLDAANRGGTDKKAKKNSLVSAFAKHRPRISSSPGQSSKSSSNRRLDSQDSLEQKFVSKKDGSANQQVAVADEATPDDQEEANSHITFLSKGSNKGAAFKKTARTAFCEMSKYAGIAFGSLGVITLGAMYIKK